jgi:hypothetical protein
MSRKSVNYTKYFCEENIWHFCQHEEFKSFPKYVLFISNAEKKCPFWFQKSARPFEPIIWDYHVIFAVKLGVWTVFDLDTTLQFPLELKQYFTNTFLELSKLSSNLYPRFKIIEAEKYAVEFYSDRSHMKDENGNWLATPPSWPLIENSKKTSIYELLDFSGTSKQKIFNLKNMLDYFEEQ